ncbi:RICIN domain-containing protein [Streptacidiphilus carbonis]|uniref:RICIN domain-containing protein n=1 Tax=Streptacidiphilus carbonis TaxID=105422 RepID=UPI0005A962BD|nr:RICIN domain-containing protein [Streptacidiphilus carbonis]
MSPRLRCCCPPVTAPGPPRRRTAGAGAAARAPARPPDRARSGNRPHAPGRTRPTTDTYTVVNELSGKCLDVSGASTADGAAVIQYTCNGQTNHQFTLNPVTALGNSKDYQLVATHGGKCVDVSDVSKTAGAKIHQWTCDPASALTTKKNQIWRLQGLG